MSIDEYSLYLYGCHLYYIINTDVALAFIRITIKEVKMVEKVLVDVNNADEQELTLIPGIGPKLARRIIDGFTG